MTALIRYQGIKLFLRGLPVVRRPTRVLRSTTRRFRKARRDDVRAPTTTGKQAPPAGPWTQLPAVPRAPIHAAIARRIFTRAATRLGVTVELPDGRLLVKAADTQASAAGPGRAAPVMRLHRPAQFFRRLGHDGLIGFGESYMAGDWDADDVAAVLTPFARRMAGLVPGVLQRARRWYDARQPASENNDLHGSKSNISRHYDLSNELFALFLDQTMTYSSAIWDDTRSDATRERWPARRSARSIGCWISPACKPAPGCSRSAPAGVNSRSARPAAARDVTTVTLSHEQQAWAIRRAELAGVGRSRRRPAARLPRSHRKLRRGR